MDVLLIATLPRQTWITAPDKECAKAIRQLLDGRFDAVRREGRTDPYSIDVGIGVEAPEAGEMALAAD